MKCKIVSMLLSASILIIGLTTSIYAQKQDRWIGPGAPAREGSAASRKEDRWVGEGAPARARNPQAPSVREQYGDQDSFFSAREPSEYGHNYESLNSLGKSRLSEEQAFEAVFGRGLDPVMPLVSAIGTSGQSITVGNRYNLRFAEYDMPVEVVAKTKTSFTLKTLDGHPLAGTITHGIFKDRSGELWLYQRGNGVLGEPKPLQRANYLAARGMWPDMAAKAKEFIPRSSIPDPTRDSAQPQHGQIRGVPGTTTNGRRHRF
ncbi:MAG: hypothetical protein V7641_4249 [Blastocatellia bacterium]